MAEIENILAKIDRIEESRIEEGGFLNFLGNTANLLFKGQSFAQSNLNRAQQALTQQNEKDKLRKQAITQGAAAVKYLDGFKDTTTVGKTAEEVVELLNNLSSKVDTIKQNADTKNANTEQLDTVVKVLGNGVTQKGSIGGIIIGLIQEMSDYYDRNYKNKGLTAFMADYASGKISNITAQQDTAQYQQHVASLQKDFTQNMKQILTAFMSKGITGAQLAQFVGGNA